MRGSAMNARCIDYDYNAPENDSVFRRDLEIQDSKIARDHDGDISLSLGGLVLGFENDREFFLLVNLISKFFWGQSWS